MKVNRWLLAAALACVASRGSAQVTDSIARINVPVSFWGSISVGGAHPSNAPGTHFAGQFGAFGAYGPWVLGYHSAGTGGEDQHASGAWDQALLFGRRMVGQGSELVLAAGPSSIRDELGHWGPGISFTSHAAATAIVYGIGVSAFGAWRPHTSYVGAGFTVDLGKMH